MLAGGNEIPFAQLINCAQSQLQWWNQLIQATGYALNPAKCCCAVYSWYPNKFGILHSSTPNPNEVLICLAPQQPEQCISVLASQEGTRYLGIYITRNGSTKPMEIHMWQKTVLYTKVFQWTQMSCHKAGVLYHSCILWALTYSFPAMWLPYPFWNESIASSHPPSLTKWAFTTTHPAAWCLHHATLVALGCAI